MWESLIRSVGSIPELITHIGCRSRSASTPCSHADIWLRWSSVAVGTLRLSGLSGFIRIDELFGALHTWQSSEHWLWILKVLTRPTSFQREQFSLFIQSAVRKLCWIGGRRGTIWWNERKNGLGWFAPCVPHICLLFSLVNCLFVFPINVLY